jgi:hypothetical protein
MKHALESLPNASLEDLMFIMQGFRNKSNKNLY